MIYDSSVLGYKNKGKREEKRDLGGLSR